MSFVVALLVSASVLAGGLLVLVGLYTVVHVLRGHVLVFKDSRAGFSGLCKNCHEPLDTVTWRVCSEGSVVFTEPHTCLRGKWKD